MRLGHFATIVGAQPRWVQNAFQVLDFEPEYDEERAKVLGLARQLHEALRIPLVTAYPLAQEALTAWPDMKVWRWEDDAGIVTLEVDLERYLSTYAARLSLSRTWYAEKKRGRPPKRPEDPIEAARQYGIDISLLQEQLRRSPAERLRTLDEAIDFVQSVRLVDE